MNIVLIGFMGIGKTKVGRMLAKRIGMEHVDTDAVIVERAGKSINNIFAEIGEAGFRKFESEVILEVSIRDNIVVSCGGGVVVNEKNMELLTNSSRIYLLRAKLENIKKWLENDNKRPLAKDAEELYAKREELYEKYADIIIDVDDIKLEKAVDKICEDAKK